ncbi:MAG TPA: hypothetical protein VNZ52_03070 [Candidatus Thermoplasmatota archaeon]|nr:hypothetical protein [Candidatus Thermoplasmatota archaeon]
MKTTTLLLNAALGLLLTVGFMFPTATAKDPATVNLPGVYLGECIVNVGSCAGDCEVNVGLGATCRSDANCFINAATCAGGGNCMVNGGYCGYGGTCDVNLGWCYGDCEINIGYCGPTGNCTVNVGDCWGTDCGSTADIAIQLGDGTTLNPCNLEDVAIGHEINISRLLSRQATVDVLA